MSTKEKEDMVSDFIDDLNKEKKPRVYKNKIKIDKGMEKTFETIRAVKRTRGKIPKGRH